MNGSFLAGTPGQNPEIEFYTNESPSYNGAMVETPRRMVSAV
jgi:hypothetical protein